MTGPDTAPDADTMAAVHAAAYRLDRPWTAAEFRGLTDSPHILALGDARAFILVRIIADEAEVLTIATHPDHRRKGLARDLLARFHAEALARGATSAFLDVAADNAPAIALYLGAGYARLGQRRAYYPRQDAPAADALLLRRALD
ncbi:MAG: GNAT family N-acetyltransferase [Rhodobacterales bacterium]|nr:GNAT family N-acetyltransferase [Rhodobacterales bacterium]MDX5391453.1 GNAT family N-acetyltransferase [Rhodobacterales bacterium]MDX5491153.1 GNAT family N-acetyltransferase [Rhodobacterales bacterium]